MAGILANSVTQTMGSGDTAADKTVTGYLINEAIALSTFPAGTAWLWGIAKPSGATVRSNLNATSVAAPAFVPDAEGWWTITCTVDSTTTYVIRISVLALTQTTIAQAWRTSPVADATVPDPPAGEALFFSKDVGRWRAKDSSGTVRDVDPGARTGTLTMSGGTGTITDASVTANTVVALNCTTATDRGTLTFATTPGTNIVATSSDGSDASIYKYALIG